MVPHDSMRGMEILLTGVVQSGGPINPQPIPGATVTLFEATSDQPTVIDTKITDDKGRFEMTTDYYMSERIFYATAKVDHDIELVTIIGPSIVTNFPAWITAPETDERTNAAFTASIVINELTTVAAAFSMAQFVTSGVIGGDAFGLRIASLMNDNLVSIRDGASSEVLLTPPNEDETNSLRSTRSLANLIAACVQKLPSAAKDLFEHTTPPNGYGPIPTNTFQALLNIAHYPANNVSALFEESLEVTTYSPALESEPEAWTLAVKVNRTSAADDKPFGGPGNIAFDERGYAWITNNVDQGTPSSGQYAVVLKPNGKPADGSPTTPWESPDGLPTSPLQGGGLFGGGFGVVVEKSEQPNSWVWLSNFGWGTSEHWPTEGGVSRFTLEGRPWSPEPFGIAKDTLRVQGIAIDPKNNNLWLASYGDPNEDDLCQVVVYLKGDPNQSLFCPVPTGYAPFGVAVADDGRAWVTCNTGLYEYTDGMICRFKIDYENLTLKIDHAKPLGRGLKGLSIDSTQHIWVAGGGSDAVLLLDPAGEHIGTIRAGGVNGPWGTTIDGNDNVWVTNFGQMVPHANYTEGGLTQLKGANPDTPPAGLQKGDPITPDKGYTLPTAGKEVTLPSGEKLYGRNSNIECYSPLMRQTSCQIDQAGNVWVCNNWKPDFDIDFPPDTGNPGGDGIVIFVGLAKPPRK